MNLSADPCQNFYQYACGRFDASQIRRNEENTGTHQILYYAEQEKLIRTLNSLADNPPDNLTAAVKTAVNIYRTCRDGGDEEAYKKFITDEGHRILDELGGWPMVKPDWKDLPSGETVFTLIGKIHRNHGGATFLRPEVMVDLKHVDHHALSFRNPWLVYNNNRDLEKNATIDNFLSVLYPDVKISSQLEADIAAMLSLAESLSRSVEAVYEKHADLQARYNPYTLTGLKNTWKNIDWTGYLTTLLDVSEEKIADVHYVVQYPKTMDQVDQFFGECLKNGSCKRNLVNYLGLCALQVWYFATLADYEPGDESGCADYLIETLPIVTGRIYVGEHYPQAKRCSVRSLIDSLACAFDKQLRHLSWMDARTKHEAVKKLTAVLKNVAYPDWMMDDQKLNAYFADLSAKITAETTAAETYLLLSAFDDQKKLSKLWQRPDRREFHESPATYGAFYVPPKNAITVPATIMNSPFFDLSFPAAVNYGALGMMLGHELTHAFDLEGFNLTWNGTLHNWLSTASEPGFRNMAQCFVDQYSKICYNVSGEMMCINGTKTESENIADNSGLKAAYNAYQNYVKTRGAEKPVPGVAHLSMVKIFFIAFAQVWCNPASEFSLRLTLLTDNHSPNDARVNEPLKNMPEFAKAFKCKPGDPMAPEKRCAIW